MTETQKAETKLHTFLFSPDTRRELLALAARRGGTMTAVLVAAVHEAWVNEFGEDDDDDAEYEMVEVV